MRKTVEYFVIGKPHSSLEEFTTQVTSERAVQEILAGKLRGLSMGIRINGFGCSICGQDYETCDHIQGKVCNSRVAHAIGKNIEAIDISFVYTPKDKGALISDFIIRDNQTHTVIFKWIAMIEDGYEERTRRILKHRDRGVITSEAAKKFIDYFSINVKGEVEFVSKR